MNDLIFVALSTFSAEDSAPLRKLEESGFPVRIHSTGKRISREELIRDGADAAVILAGVEPYDADVLSRLPALRCISRCGVGTDAIDHAAAKERNIAVRNTPGIPTQAVAELALTMILALCRNLPVQVDFMRARKWERVSANLLGGRTVGLFGLGQIGRKVAQLCRAFDARVLACDPNVTSADGVSMVSKSELLSESDIVSIHASKTPGDSVLIGAAEIARMKPGALLVNLARGDMIDEAALIQALESGRIAGAGLDVFSAEPYSGPLCDFKQVILTPHSATLTRETRVAMEMMCVENALAFLRDGA